MAISKEEVLKIAYLARLELSSTEIEKYVTQLSAILEYIQKLDELKIEGIEPTAHAISVSTPFREDERIDDRSDRERKFFKVPRVIT